MSFSLSLQNNTKNYVHWPKFVDAGSGLPRWHPLLGENWDKGGVLILNERHKCLIRLSMKNLNCASVIKFQHMLGYQIELGCHITLPKDMNASKNLGYEAVQGIVSSSG